MNARQVEREKVILDAGLYSAASIITQLVTLVAAILSRRFLGPTQMGLWSLLQIILVYSAYTTFGVAEAISREIPYYQGKGDDDKITETADTIFSFSALTAVISAAALLVYAFWSRAHLSEVVFYGLIFMSALVILQRLNNLYISFLRGYKLFGLASRQMIYSSIINAVLVAVLSYRFQIYGFMWAMCFSFLFNIVYILAHHRFVFAWRLEREKIISLIRYGSPLLLVGLTGALFLTIDKLMIAKMLGLEALGIYSVAILTYTYLGTVPNSIGVVLIPNFHQRFGETENLRDLKGYLSKSSDAFSAIMPLLIAGGWFLVPYFARIVLPDYMGSIEPMRFLIVSAYFLALAHPYSYFITVMRKQMILVPIMAGVCFLAFVSNFLVLQNGWGLVGVGMATTFVVFVRFTATYFIACRVITPLGECLRDYGIKLGKFLFMTACLFIVKAFFPDAERSFGQSLLQWLIFAAIYAPFLWRLNRQTDFFGAVRRRFWGARKEIV
ncbi:MAG: oligosaccharide flippase family protein [Candidatus Omnitrophica bacterium]|nr:oligosaccharide flippase family protein [Candidatus Omnitrophota bacterium]